MKHASRGGSRGRIRSAPQMPASRHRAGRNRTAAGPYARNGRDGAVREMAGRQEGSREGAGDGGGAGASSGQVTEFVHLVSAATSGVGAPTWLQPKEWSAATMGRGREARRASRQAVHGRGGAIKSVRHSLPPSCNQCIW